MSSSQPGIAFALDYCEITAVSHLDFRAVALGLLRE